jgi:hypothetical protein
MLGNCVGAISFVPDGGVDQAGATMKTTFKLPVALASAPLQTARIAAKSFICGRTNSRRLNDDSLLLSRERRVHGLRLGKQLLNIIHIKNRLVIALQFGAESQPLRPYPHRVTSQHA